MVLMQCPGKSVDGAQRRAEIVRDGIAELLELGVGPGELLLDTPPLGHVPHDGQYAHDLSALADEWRVPRFEDGAGCGLARAVAAAFGSHRLAFEGRREVLVLAWVLQEREHLQRRPPQHFLGAQAADPCHAVAPQGAAGLPVERQDPVRARVDQLLDETLLAAQLRFGPPALGQIPGHLGEADQGPLRVPNRRDHHIGPEAGAVLADAPPFVLELPVPDRPIQLPLRLSLSHVLRQIEAGEVPAENLLCTVSLDPFGTGVPADDPSLAVEREDRVIPYTLHHQAEPLLISP